MTVLGGLALALLSGTLASSSPPPAVPGLSPAPVRVEPRLLVKERSTFVGLGATYLARGDYYTAPGLAASLSFYPRESDGFELKGSWFRATLSGAAQEVLNLTGLKPDAHRPRGALFAGWRRSIGYGKLLVGHRRSGLLHFDLQAAGHLGAVFTDRAITPALNLSPGLVMRVGDHFFSQLDVSLSVAIESRRNGSIAVGVQPTLLLGVRS
jgi:hypothetical protein